MEDDWQRVHEELIQRASQRLDATLSDAVSMARELADRGAEASSEPAPMFRVLRDAIDSTDPERGVAVLDTTGVFRAWAGRHRVRPETGSREAQREHLTILRRARGAAPGRGTCGRWASAARRSLRDSRSGGIGGGRIRAGHALGARVLSARHRTGRGRCVRLLHPIVLRFESRYAVQRPRTCSVTREIQTRPPRRGWKASGHPGWPFRHASARRGGAVWEGAGRRRAPGSRHAHSGRDPRGLGYPVLLGDVLFPHPRAGFGVERRPDHRRRSGDGGGRVVVAPTAHFTHTGLVACRLAGHAHAARASSPRTGHYSARNGSERFPVARLANEPGRGLRVVHPFRRGAGACQRRRGLTTRPRDCRRVVVSSPWRALTLAVGTGQSVAYLVFAGLGSGAGPRCSTDRPNPGGCYVSCRRRHTGGGAHVEHSPRAQNRPGGSRRGPSRRRSGPHCGWAALATRVGTRGGGAPHDPVRPLRPVAGHHAQP